MGFLTPAPSTNVAAARHDLAEALKRYLDSERVGPGGVASDEDVFEVQMLGIVRRHAMELAPDIVRYLKAVLTAEATVRELDPAFDLRTHENRFFRRLTQIELVESFTVAGAAQWIVDARFRVRRVLEAVEGLSEESGDLVAVARRDRRRARTLALVAAFGWVAVLSLLLGGFDVASIGGGPWRSMVAGVGLLAVVVLVVSIVELRRARREGGASGRDRYRQ
jgi:predicted unusual protein kinase regulating ubiquinone biosynthesis (AarF/ABC1/UbiB family)